MPLRFSEFPEDLPLEAATLGQHNADILRDWLGRSDKEIEELQAAKVLQDGDV
jgi:crotonobetainyl-CoA:carnitine CoA-transferase CaiB-like acyl-CoA transferase